MVGPNFERAAFLGAIQTSVINASDTAPVAGNVAEDGFDDVRLDAKAFVQRRRQRSPEIVQRPMRNRAVGSGNAGVEFQLALAATLKSALAVSENKIARSTTMVGAPWLRFENIERRRGERNFMRLSGLGPLGR